MSHSACTATSSRRSRAAGKGSRRRLPGRCRSAPPPRWQPGRDGGGRQARLHLLDLGQISRQPQAQRGADVVAGPVDDRSGSPCTPPTSATRRRRSHTVGSGDGSPKPRAHRDEFGLARSARRTARPGRPRIRRRARTASLSTRTSATKAPCAPCGRICPSRSDSTMHGAARQVTRSCSRGCRPTAALDETVDGDEIVTASRWRALDTLGDGGNTTTILGSIQ